MSARNTIAFVLSLVCAVGSIMFGYWPLAFLGILCAAYSGWATTAIALAFFFDITFGAPVGVLHALQYPLTLLAILIVLVRAFFIRHLRDRRLY